MAVNCSELLEQAILQALNIPVAQSRTMSKHYRPGSVTIQQWNDFHSRPMCRAYIIFMS